MNKIFESKEWRLWDLGRPIANGKPSDFPRRFRLERKGSGSNWSTLKSGLNRGELMDLLEELGSFILRVEGYE